MVTILVLSIIGISAFFALKKHNSVNQVNSVRRDICVAYSTDNNYIYPTIVSMTSLMENANKDTFCKFTILTADNVTEEDKGKIKTVNNHYPNCSINIVDMGQQFSNSAVKNWSKAMYYRLNLPEILTNEKKCIYLDGDTVVRKDISDMFEIDMNNYYIAGVRDINSYINKKSDYYKVLGIPNLNSYVCSGVLIMNLEKMRNDNLHKTLDKIITENDIKKTFKFPDQDTLNSACYGHILALPFKYGALAHIDFSKSYGESEYAQWVSNQKDWEQGRKDPSIVHFTGTKPWVSIYSDFCKSWWDYVKKTDFQKEISEKYKIS